MVVCVTAHRRFFVCNFYFVIVYTTSVSVLHFSAPAKCHRVYRLNWVDSEHLNSKQLSLDSALISVIVASAPLLCLCLIQFSFVSFSFRRDYYCYRVAVACRVARFQWCKDTKRAITSAALTQDGGKNIFSWTFFVNRGQRSCISTHHHFICWHFVVLIVLDSPLPSTLACDLRFKEEQIN